eukprot:352945-Chlamydomonas_euryale.AAC.4
MASRGPRTEGPFEDESLWSAVNPGRNVHPSSGGPSASLASRAHLEERMKEWLREGRGQPS